MSVFQLSLANHKKLKDPKKPIRTKSRNHADIEYGWQTRENTNRVASVGKHDMRDKRGKRWNGWQARENTNQVARAGKRVQAWGNFQTDTVVWWWARKLWFKLMCFFAFRKKFHSYSLEQRNASLMHEWCWTTICRILRYIYMHMHASHTVTTPAVRAAVNIELLYRNDTVMIFSVALMKQK